MKNNRSIFLNNVSGFRFFPWTFLPKNFLRAKTIPYSNMATRIGACIPTNHTSMELKPLLGGALTELYVLIWIKQSIVSIPILPGNLEQYQLLVTYFCYFLLCNKMSSIQPASNLENSFVPGTTSGLIKNENKDRNAKTPVVV